MPRVPTLSPATGKTVPAHYIHTTAGQFVDTAGRTVIFRGVNLSGSSKAPVGQQSQVIEGFWEKAEAGGESFVNQPLNLDDGTADVHLARLRGWGFNFLRFPVTWEALEHAGPRKYDYEFMDYVVRVLRKCKEFGFKVFMDPHQDVWSRFTGGSGAPLWTVHACGLDPKNLTRTLAHVLHCESEDPQEYPAMIWSTNYGRLSSQTLFTMFFAGREFAPKCIIDGVNIQDWLQDHFISAFGALADRIRDTAADLFDECIVGWDSMNEPSEGLIGYPDLTKSSTKQTAQLKKGPYATPAQGFRLGMGTAQTLENWEFGGFGPSQKGTVTVDPQGLRAWLDPSAEPGCVSERWGWKRDPEWTLGTCVWALHGVWDIASGEVLQPQYFHPNDAEPVFTAEYFRPHWQKWAARIRSAHPEAVHFLQPPVFVPPPPLDEADVRGRLAYSTHYYDGLTLVSRHWHWYNADAVGVMRGKYSAPWKAAKFGESAIRQSFQEQLAILKNDAPTILGDYPTIIGEIGTPFDMDNRWSYGYTDGGRGLGNYKNQQKALDASLNGCDGANALNYTLWTYCPDGSHKWGDGWNLEDLSIWCADDLRSARPPKYASAGSSPSLSVDAATRTPLLDRGHALDVTKAALSPTKAMSATAFDITSVASWDSAWDFLTDGARAVGAFVRPFPRATVGTPVRWDFDIAKATYSFIVKVSADDAPPTSATNPDEASPPTELFIPLVHYAAPEALLWSSSRDGDDGNTPDVSALDVSSTKSKRSAADLSMQSLAYADSPGGSSTALASGGMQLALEVKVSDGRWDVLHGSQTLRWWYRVPARGEPDVEYRIDIKRAGGPIRTHANGRPVLSGEAVQEEWSLGQVCTDLKNWCFST